MKISTDHSILEISYLFPNLKKAWLNFFHFQFFGRNLETSHPTAHNHLQQQQQQHMAPVSECRDEIIEVRRATIVQSILVICRFDNDE